VYNLLSAVIEGPAFSDKQIEKIEKIKQANTSRKRKTFIHCDPGLILL